MLDLDISQLGMTEIIRLQTQLSEELTRRFEKSLALSFTDIVGSTEYFARFGDEAGRRLQQRHYDLLAEALLLQGGRIVDTAGDGAFSVFPTVRAAAAALIEFQKCVSVENMNRARDHQLIVRIGLHWGRVLTDGSQVTGDAVNLAARVTSTAGGGEIRVTREAFQELGTVELRAACRSLGTVALKGIGRIVDLMALEWRDRARFPTVVWVEETGEEFPIPPQDTVAFGRLADADGAMANDIVLTLPDPNAAMCISRWHFELRRGPDCYQLRSLSTQITEVDGRVVEQGVAVPILPGAKVRLSGVLTLDFRSPLSKYPSIDATIRHKPEDLAHRISSLDGDTKGGATAIAKRPAPGAE